jgi:hypothetical protein
MPQWTKEQALAFGAKGRARAQQRLAEWHHLRAAAFAILRRGEHLPTFQRLDDINRKLITLLLSAPAGPRAERMAKIIELITRAQRNLSDAKPPQPPPPSTDSADFRPIG